MNECPVEAAELRRDQETSFSSDLEERAFDKDRQEKLNKAFEARAKDSMILSEALSYDGIQYPSGSAYSHGTNRGRSNRQAWDDLYFAQLSELMINHYHGDEGAANRLGQFLMDQAHQYIISLAEGDIQ